MKVAILVQLNDSNRKWFQLEIIRLFLLSYPMSTFINFNMNIDSVYSNFFHSEVSKLPISLISNANDENSFFDNFFHFEDNQNINSRESQIFLLQENEGLGKSSLLDHIGFESNHQGGSTMNSNYWVLSSKQLGQSESQSEPEEIQIPSTTGYVFDHISKHKVIRKPGSCVKTSQESNKDDSRIQAKKFQNETKNLPKNFGKAIIAFALSHFKDFSHLPEFTGIRFDEFKKQLTQIRKSLNTIQKLKKTWTDFKYSRCMRVLSNRFLRRHALSYIFNSKISNIAPHVKYRFKLLEAIKCPQTFTSIKDF